MGTTLQHGIFLPAEGERNCYTGLASNWTILDGVVGGYSSHAANLTIHVTAADKEAWNGKADASALTAHTGNTTIHVTAADKTKWDAVTNKANDADVMHLTGDETAGGNKAFTNNITAPGVKYISSAETSGQGSSILSLYSTLVFLSGDPSITACLNFRVLGADGSKSLYPHETGQYVLGLTSRRYANTWTNAINTLNPGTLSLPDLTAGVDISGYFTTGTTENTYTPTVNGWVCIRGTSSGTSGIFVENSNGFYASANSIVAYTGTDRYVNLCFPVIGGESYNIVLKSVNTSIAAKFFPCQGNV